MFPKIYWWLGVSCMIVPFSVSGEALNEINAQIPIDGCSDNSRIECGYEAKV